LTDKKKKTADLLKGSKEHSPKGGGKRVSLKTGPFGVKKEQRRRGQVIKKVKTENSNQQQKRKRER